LVQEEVDTLVLSGLGLGFGLEEGFGEGPEYHFVYDAVGSAYLLLVLEQSYLAHIHPQPQFPRSQNPDPAEINIFALLNDQIYTLLAFQSEL
jgi:hypothetical protein